MAGAGVDQWDIEVPQGHYPRSGPVTAEPQLLAETAVDSCETAVPEEKEQRKAK